MATRYVPLSSFDRLTANLFSPARLDRQIPMDALQRDDRLVLHFDLPGVAEDAVELSLERRVLTVRAERSGSVRDGDTVFVAERPSGAMSRQVVLGDTLDLDAVHAHLDAGVLTVSIPVSAKARSRRIEIGHAPVQATAEVTETAAT